MYPSLDLLIAWRGVARVAVGRRGRSTLDAVGALKPSMFLPPPLYDGINKYHRRGTNTHAPHTLAPYAKKVDCAPRPLVDSAAHTPLSVHLGCHRATSIGTANH